MTKFIVVMLLCGIAVQASYAQTEKGTQNLGLSLNFATATSHSTSFDPYTLSSYRSETKNNSFGISPSYSYFVADKLDLSISAGYSYSNSDTDNGNVFPQKQTQRRIAGTIQLRKYFLFNDKIGIRTGPLFSYERGKQTAEYNSIKSSYNTDTYNGGLRLDFVYYPFKKVGFASTIGNMYYTYQKADNGNTPADYKSFQVNFVDYLNLSFFYIF